MGGGVCIEPAERMMGSISSSRPSFNGVDAGFKVRLPLRLVEDDEREGFGDDESWRDASTGGSLRLELGDR